MLLVLETLTQTAETYSGGAILASILLLDRTGKYLLHGAAPSLPEAYNEVIHGLAIGPEVGSCGSAAYSAQPVLVDDIASSELWKDYANLALSHACSLAPRSRSFHSRAMCWACLASTAGKNAT